uniref:Uncharacterized protein n=1 Tax=Pyxicephalus adspersus TaxID=30357 RepID=A0AAV3ABE0_PYXAD|nr:TPA: hypothetical protein GDO54_012555 [Pyxicephalus adspersus]
MEEAAGALLVGDDGTIFLGSELDTREKPLLFRETNDLSLQHTANTLDVNIGPSIEKLWAVKQLQLALGKIMCAMMNDLPLCLLA